jgi:alpha-glucosidase
MVRVRVARGDRFANDFSYAVIQSAQGKFTSMQDQGGQIVLSTGELNVVVNKDPFRIKFLDKNMRSLNEDDNDFGISWLGTEVTCYKKLFAGERFIGLGEKTGDLDRRGTAYENWNSDVPAYRATQDPLYATIPFFIGLHDQMAYGIFQDNSYRTAFNFGASTDDKMSSFTASDGELNYYFIGSGDVASVVKDYTWLTGRPKLPPLWSFGYQQCRWSYFPDSEVLRIAGTFREKRIPADVIYLDINYMDHYKVFTFHPQDFPKPAEMVSALKKMGFHVAVIVDPGLKVEAGYSAYDEGVKNNYFVKYPNGQNYIGEVWPGRSSFPDFTNPKVRNWWGGMFGVYTTKGIEGFWNDMNEPSAWGQNIPGMVEFDFDGNRTTMKQAHNVFGMQMSRSTYEGARRLMNGKRPLVITRATYSGGQRYSTIWTGDNASTDEHMLLGVRLINSLGLCGFSFAGPDIGGFMGEPSKELLTRWLSVGIYTPFLRNHSEYHTPYREPWVFGKDFEAISRGLIEQRYRLLPYIYSTAYEATQTGMPVARTLAINYSFDNAIYRHDYQNEYLFGDNILVTPIISSAQFGKVYLPEGNWYRLTSGQAYSGHCEVVVEAPLNDLPVFAREGAIIPMQSVAQNTSEKTDETLYVHVYNGSKDTSFRYYEDDGVSYEFENGEFCQRLFSYHPERREILMGAQDGHFRSKFKKVNLVLHSFDDISKAQVDGSSLPVSREGQTVQTLGFELSDREMKVTW